MDRDGNRDRQGSERGGEGKGGRRGALRRGMKGLLTATLIRRKSDRRSPILHSVLFLTSDRSITSLSLPWYLSTVHTSTALRPHFASCASIAASWSLKGLMMPMSHSETPAIVE